MDRTLPMHWNLEKDFKILPRAAFAFGRHLRRGRDEGGVFFSEESKMGFAQEYVHVQVWRAKLHYAISTFIFD